MLTASGQPIGQAIGFQTKEVVRKEEPTINYDDIMLTFDNGETISFADASHNMVVLGTTGSGKTSQVILPSLYSLIKAGFGGVVIDVKGNVANHVRMIAREVGRENDVIEFGPGPDATPINLFHGKISYEREQLFRTLFCSKFDGHADRNAIFYEEGVRKGMDCLDLCMQIKKKIGRKFNFQVFNRMIRDVEFAQDMNTHYMKKLYDKENFDEFDLVQRISSDALHFIMPPGQDTRKSTRAFAEQNTYRMTYVRNGVDNYSNIPGVIENFIADTPENIDMERRIYKENKVIVLRLANETGACGDTLARFILREYYQAVFN